MEGTSGTVVELAILTGLGIGLLQPDDRRAVVVATLKAGDFAGASLARLRDLIAQALTEAELEV